MILPTVLIWVVTSLYTVQCEDRNAPLTTRVDELSDDVAYLKRELSSLGEIVRSEIASQISQLEQGHHLIKGQLSQVQQEKERELKCVLVEQPRSVETESSPGNISEYSGLEWLVTNTSMDLELTRQELASVVTSLNTTNSELNNVKLELTLLKTTLNTTEDELRAEISRLNALLEKSVQTKDESKKHGQYFCEENWIRHDTSCYLFIGIKDSWMAARKMCEARGAALASVETAKENNFIRDYLMVFSRLGANMATWLSGNDIDEEGTWKWSPSGERMTFTDWFPGQPNPNGDCLIIWPGHVYHWGDTKCYNLASAMCEKPSSQVFTTG